MWMILAFASSVFAALTTILAKCGIKKTDSTVATAIRTSVVVVFAWLMVLVVGSFEDIADVEPESWIFLILSGLLQEHPGCVILRHCSWEMSIK